MATATQSSVVPTQATAVVDQEIAGDAYDSFWACVEREIAQDKSEKQRTESQPMPGAAYQEFLDR